MDCRQFYSSIHGAGISTMHLACNSLSGHSGGLLTATELIAKPPRSPILTCQRRTMTSLCSPSFSRVTVKCGIRRAKLGKVEHHLWMKRDSSGSGQKALDLVRIVSKLPNEKEAVYGTLDKWSAWETEFPLVAAAKALGILRKRRQWLHVIQVTMWLLSKGQCMTMTTFDTLLLAFDMEGRLDEAETIWNLILRTHTRSVPKSLFSRMMSLYDHHHMPEKLLDVFTDMEELGVKPDEDTVRRIGKTFLCLGEEDKQKLVYKRYGMKWKYIHFNGERVKVKTEHHQD